MLTTAVFQPNIDSSSVRLHRGSRTLLLVDDDPIVLAVLETVLILEGYRVITTLSPTSALQVAKKSNVSMLITDFQTPEMNGFELASSLVCIRPPLPVLVLSGADPSEIPIAEIERRRWNFMAKPIHRERLVQIVDGECMGWALRT